MVSGACFLVIFGPRQRRRCRGRWGIGNAGVSGLLGSFTSLFTSEKSGAVIPTASAAMGFSVLLALASVVRACARGACRCGGRTVERVMFFNSLAAVASGRRWARMTFTAFDNAVHEP